MERLAYLGSIAAWILGAWLGLERGVQDGASEGYGEDTQSGKRFLL